MQNWSEHKPASFEYKGRWVFNWFSNMVYSPFHLHGIKWPSVENYYQASKAPTITEQYRLARMKPHEAKLAGRTLKLRADWDQIKYEVMKQALRAKFNLPEWKEKLLATGDEVLIEWNNWGDKIWGVDVVTCEGENLLGKALMEIRDELKNA